MTGRTDRPSPDRGSKLAWAVLVALTLGAVGCDPPPPTIERVTQPTPTSTVAPETASPSASGDPEARAALVARVPKAYRASCFPVARHPLAAGATASIACTPEDQPVAVFYFSFASVRQMDRRVDRLLAEHDIDGRRSCGRDAGGRLFAQMGAATWSRDGERAGRVATFDSGEGVDVLWTDERLRIVGHATHFDGEVEELCRWWDSTGVLS